MFKILIFIIMFVVTVSTAYAHTPLMVCFDNGDNTITCQGGFSDGSSAAGVLMQIQTPSGRIILSGRMDSTAEFIFTKPRGDFVVVLDAGPEHQVKVPGRQITE